MGEALITRRGGGGVTSVTDMSSAVAPQHSQGDTGHGVWLITVDISKTYAIATSDPNYAPGMLAIVADGVCIYGDATVDADAGTITVTTYSTDGEVIVVRLD